MKRRPSLDVASAIGLPAGVAVVMLAQALEGGSLRSLWQPTAALVVFGGTLGALLLSYPFEALQRTGKALWEAFTGSSEALEATIARLVAYAHQSRRKGVMGLEPEIDRAPEAFLRSALTLVVDGTAAETTRHILDIESQSRREWAELPAEVLETGAGYTPTLGILGAVLGLIHVMESLSEPSRLGAGIAVAFVATVYGVATANLILLPLATKLRMRARRSGLYRDIVVEGIVVLQEGLHPRLIEQKLYGFLTAANTDVQRRRAA